MKADLFRNSSGCILEFKMSVLSSLVIIFISFISLTEALYFYVTDQPRCFIEEVPSETLVVGSYKNPDFIEWGTTGAEFTGVVSYL